MRDLDTRWKQIKKLIPDAVARATGPVNMIAHASLTGQDPVRAFQSFLDEAMRQLVLGGTGYWTLAYVRGAGDMATHRAGLLASARVVDAGPDDEPRDNSGKWIGGLSALTHLSEAGMKNEEFPGNSGMHELSNGGRLGKSERKASGRVKAIRAHTRTIYHYVAPGEKYSKEISREAAISLVKEHRLKIKDAGPDDESRDERGRWTEGSSAGSSTQTKTPAFKNWFGESKIVDENGKPLVLYHGTTQDFNTFSPNGNIESNFGNGAYFSNTPEDTNENYAGFGPDLTQKLENYAERLQNENEDLSEEDAKAQARAKFASNEGAVLPVYLKMEHPFENGGKNETFLDYHDNYNHETEEHDGEPHGKLVDFIDNLRTAAVHNDAEPDDAIQKIMEYAQNNDGIKASDLENIIRGDEKLAYAQDLDSGDMSSHEVFRYALEKTGFDGVIDHSVFTKFGGGRKIGQKMKGITRHTKHYIVFKSHQIKSAIGNKGTFNPKSGDIRDAAPPVIAQDRVPFLQTLCITELQGIIEAVSQQAVRAFADGILLKQSPSMIARAITQVIDKVGIERGHLLASFMIVRAFSLATIDSFRASGVSHVGTVAERVGAPTFPKVPSPGAHTRDAKFPTRAQTRAENKLQRELGGGEVDVLTAGDDDVCQVCQDISDEGPYDLDTAEQLIPAHPRCVLPGMVVEGDVLAALKSNYSGPALEIETRSGRRLCVTGQHPILTSLGPVVAQDLREGMQLVGKGLDIGNTLSTNVNANNHHGPVAIEQVYDALWLKGLCSVTPSSDDLHGDARFVDGDVDIVAVDWRLLSYVHAQTAQGRSQLVLPLADARLVVLGALAAMEQFGERGLSTFGSFPCSSTLSLDQPSVCLEDRPLEVFSLGSSTHGNIKFPKLLDENVTVYSGLIRDAFERNPGLVLLDDVSKLSALEDYFGSSGVSDDVLQYNINHASLYLQFLDNLVAGQPGLVELDDVVSLRSFHYEGPVYDLQTTTGCMIAQGLFEYNCRCAFVPADDERYASVHDAKTPVHDGRTTRAAGIMLCDLDGRVLFLRRSDAGDHAGEWCLPAGGIERGETAEQAALREVSEETGLSSGKIGDLREVDRRTSDDGVDFTTFTASVPTFESRLNDEHTDSCWRMPDNAPEPLHPGVLATLRRMQFAVPTFASRTLE